MSGIEIPLSRCADELLGSLARATGSTHIAAINGRTLLGERAMLAGSMIPNRTSAGGGCRLLDARADTVALNLARPADRELLPALFQTERLNPHDDAAIAACIAQSNAASLVMRGRTMGLALAAEHEDWLPSTEPRVQLIAGAPAHVRSRSAPRIVDLSSLWAGPLASHLLSLAGAEVIKVESRTRPDAMRDVGPFYALLNQNKSSVVLDFTDPNDRRALTALLVSADIVIEAARPRALEQLGIDAEHIVRSSPGLAWITITAHGAQGDEANWVGFGDDCGVAAGLSAALRAACGRTGFVGDAIADPLTGILAALTAWDAWISRRGGRFGLAMSHVVAYCLARARDVDSAALDNSLREWDAAAGRPFPEVQRRSIGAFAAFGEHTHACLAQVARC
jgi:hypothetical protein